MLKMFVLLEAFDEQDLAVAAGLVEERANRQEQLLVGVNSRDLDTLQVVPERLLQLASHLPAGVPHVAESGVATPEDAARLKAAGYDVALIGSALMKASDPRALLSSLLAAGRG
jgi:indole-3-glycerol phosphate synthase